MKYIHHIKKQYLVLIFLSLPVRPRIFTMLLRPAVSILTDIKRVRLLIYTDRVRLLIYLEDTVIVSPSEEAVSSKAIAYLINAFSNKKV